MMVLQTFVMVSLLVGAPGEKAETLSDERPPETTYQGPASARLARPAVIRFDRGLAFETNVVRQGKPSSSYGATDVARKALAAFALETARRHFEDASWPVAKRRKASKMKMKKKRSKGPHYEIVIKRIAIEASRGPSYNVMVDIDRVENGRRRGSATGRGWGMPDRTNERMGAALAPGILGFIAGKKAVSPKPAKDAAVIEMATIRALDSALLQAAAVWAGEQYVEDLQRKNRR